MDDATRALADRAAIHDLQLRYARGVDRKDLALVASCFAAGAAYEGSLGRGDVGQALAALAAAMARYTATMHHVGNVLVELDGDRAAAETYALAYHRRRDAPGRLHTVAVRYVDRLERRDGEWRIVARTVHREWERDEDID